MFSKTRFIRPIELDPPVKRDRPTMVVEIEEPPTLTISSDEIISSIGAFLAMSIRFIKLTCITVGKTLLFLYKKLSALSIHVSFEEMREEQIVAPKPIKMKVRHPGQLDLFHDVSEEIVSDNVLPHVAEPKKNLSFPAAPLRLFWIIILGLSLGLTASMMLY